jgi:hypothetical protein
LFCEIGIDEYLLHLLIPLSIKLTAAWKDLSLLQLWSLCLKADLAYADCFGLGFLLVATIDHSCFYCRSYCPVHADKALRWERDTL